MRLTMVGGEWIGAGIAFSSVVFTVGSVLRDQSRAKASAKAVSAESVVYKDTCNAVHAGIQNEFKTIHEDLQIIKRAVTKI
jgi:hypothetical protein